jgi:hypothetical protein
MLNFGTLIWSLWPEIELQVLLVVNVAPVLKNRDNTEDQKEERGVGLIRISRNELL